MHDLLTDSSCEDVRRRYLFDADNLKIIMTLMKDNSPSISAEAFKIFRV